MSVSLKPEYNFFWVWNINNFYYFYNSDLKLYGSDTLQAICGVPAKLCTPQQYTKNIGLTVDERPFDIYFDLQPFNSSELLVQIAKKYKNGTLISDNVHEIKTLMPNYHKCNETFQYETYEYGAKCSCKVKKWQYFIQRLFFIRAFAKKLDSPSNKLKNL